MSLKQRLGISNTEAKFNDLWSLHICHISSSLLVDSRFLYIPLILSFTFADKCIMPQFVMLLLMYVKLHRNIPKQYNNKFMSKVLQLAGVLTR